MIQNLTIGKRLAFGFATLFLLLCVYSVNNYIHLSRIEASVNIVSKERLQKTIIANKIIDNINIQTASYMNMLIADSKDAVRQEYDKIQKARVFIRENLESLQKLMKDEKEILLMKRLMEARSLFIGGLDSYLKLVIEKDDKAGAALHAGRTVRPAQLDYLAKVDELVVHETESTVSETESALENIKESRIILIVFAVFLLILMTAAGAILTRSITVPLKQAVEVLNKVEADGNFKIRTDYKSKDELGVLSSSMNSLLNVFESMLTEVNGLTSAALDGRLSVRAETALLKGGFREIVGGINSTLDAVVTPLNVSADYVDRISQGIIPPKITDHYKGDFNSIKNNLNICIDSISGLIDRMNEMSRQHTIGEIDARIESGIFSGAYREMAEGINKMVFDHIQVKKSAMNVFKEFGQGNFGANIERLPGKKIFINETIDDVRANLKNLTADVNSLSAAAIEGRLSARADADQHKGDFRKIVIGINNTLDAVIRPVQEAAQVLEYLAEGNLTERVKGDYKGDHAVIKNALNKTIESFNEIIGGLIVGAEEMQKGVNQITDSNHALSQGSSEQAASIEEISSTMTELSAQTRQASANAKRANDFSLTSLSNSRHGNEMMSRLMDAMQEIKDSAHNISKILAAIDEIAFQTNLLSLNAAVEAARAGRHGKGFAVVAEEVKSLSARSANAAKETAALIQESIQKANKGVDIAQKTVKALDEIGTGAENVAGLMLEVSKSSEEQAIALSEVEKSIQQIEQVIQNNAFSSEETASASMELSGQAEGIGRMVKRFKISELPVHIARTDRSELKNSSLYRSDYGKVPFKKKNPSEVISLGEGSTEIESVRK